MVVVSFEHAFIFIKTTKTAGTSVEVELSQRIEPGAIVTPIIPAEAGHEPRNYLNAAGEIAFFNHMRADLVRKRLGSERFASMYRFTIEREPVDKCLSHFHMLKNRDDAHGLPPEEREALTWERYVETGTFPIDTPKYTDPDAPDRLLVDRVLAYETLAEELAWVMAARGLGGFALQAQAKSDYRTRQLLTRDEVTDAQRRVIYTAFKNTVKVTGLYRERAERSLGGTA
ncbi:MAG: hypothetical protein ACFE0P_03705 [Oceanicaulis sp.]